MNCVQRCTVKSCLYNNEMVSEYAKLDYMGSSEFEFGAVPKSIRELNKKKLEIFPFHYGEHVIYILCEKGQLDKIKSDMSKYLTGNLRLHEYISLADKLKGEASAVWNDNLWWDIGEHFAFSLDEKYIQGFNKALKKSLEFMDKKG